MSQKEMIVNLLKSNESMTQGDLAAAIYGDKNHSSNIYASLTGLVKKGIVLRTGSSPSYYSLTRVKVIRPENSVRGPKKYRDVSDDVISNEAMEEMIILF